MNTGKRGLVESEEIDQKFNDMNGNDNIISKIIRRDYLYGDRKFLENFTSTNLGQNTESYSYDENGIINSTLENSNLVYDSLGRVKNKDGIELIYGPSGKVENVQSAVNGQNASYLYDENGLLISKEKPGKVMQVFHPEIMYDHEMGTIIPLMIDGRVQAILHGTEVAVIPFDFRSSAVSINDNKIQDDTNESINLMDFGPYGDSKKKFSLSRLFDFATGGYDEELKAVRLGQRFYDPVAKRFLSPDPLYLEQPERCIENPVACNLYSYADNNPITKIDPNGLDAFLFIDREGAGGNGHTGIMVGNDKDGYHFFSQGAT